MKVPQHPNIALAIEALEKSNMDAAWHLLRAIPKETEVMMPVPFGYGRTQWDSKWFLPTLPAVRDDKWFPLYTSMEQNT